jgi:hypothetical protein
MATARKRHAFRSVRNPAERSNELVYCAVRETASHYNQRMRRPKGLSAWLVTWEWSGSHAQPQNKIVEILNPRMSSERVRELVELLYHRDALLAEKVAWRLRKQKQSYPAEFPILEGGKWTGEIIYGHNPWLRARLVDNLIIRMPYRGRTVTRPEKWRRKYADYMARALRAGSTQRPKWALMIAAYLSHSVESCVAVETAVGITSTNVPIEIYAVVNSTTMPNPGKLVIMFPLLRSITRLPPRLAQSRMLPGDARLLATSDT